MRQLDFIAICEHVTIIIFRGLTSQWRTIMTYHGRHSYMQQIISRTHKLPTEADCGYVAPWVQSHLPAKSAAFLAQRITEAMMVDLDPSAYQVFCYLF